MRMWEIREGYGHKDEVEEAYMEGCEHGYQKAMEEMGWTIRSSLKKV